MVNYYILDKKIIYDENKGTGMDFNTYMQLGNQLEKETKMLMAYSAYMEALRYSTEENKELLKNFLTLIASKITPFAEERNNELKSQLMEWIKAGEMLYAVSCYRNVMEHLDGMQWIDADNAFIYQCLCIYQSEANNKQTPWKMEGKSLEEIKSWFTKLRFMMRRIDMNASDDKEFVTYVKNEAISKVAIYYMSVAIGFHKERIFNYLTKTFHQYEMEEYALFFAQFGSGDVKEEFVNTCENVTMPEKIAFISAVNDEEIYEEALYYLKRLQVPEHVQIEVIPVHGAKSMTEAYNQGMKQTDANIKIYMHQDAMLVNPYILYEICSIFEDKQVGMIGVAGAEHIPDNGIWWNAKPEEIHMNLYQDAVLANEYSLKNTFSEEYKEVEALDGVLLATQYDIPWRDDLFQNWHFYDLSQCQEFKKNQYKVVVARQNYTWCVHTGKYNVSLPAEYEEAKNIFLKEYRSQTCEKK